MAASEIDIATLTEQQQLALQSYTSVTDQDVQAAIPLLRRSQWNVEFAVAKFFDGEGPDPVAEATAAQITPAHRTSRQENLQESLLFGNGKSLRQAAQPDPAPRIVPQPDAELIRRPPVLLAIIFYPFNLFYRFVSSSLGFLTYFYPSFPRFLQPRNLTPSRQNLGRRSLKPRDSAARLKREFEEEYGTNSLPFYEDGYAQALDLAKSELKFLVILLLSPEHDDTASFVRDTLLDPTVQAYFQDAANNIVFWTGDVRDSEAYQVSSAVKCSKFPYTAVVAHTANISSASMSVIAAVSGTMDASTYLAKIRASITKHEEQLAALRTSRSAQNFERTLREEQDSAYNRSLAQDRERARLKREADAAAAKAEQKRLAEEVAAAQFAENRLQWRKWRAFHIKSEPGKDEKNVVRIALKMPEHLGASRIMRKFRATDQIEELYAFVECYEHLPVQNTDVSKPDGYEHEYQFRLVQSLPRLVYNVDEGGTIGERVGQSGNLIVELIMPDDE